MGNNDRRKGYLARAKDRKIVFRSKEETKRQLQNCFEVIQKFEEKKKANQNSTSKPTATFGSKLGKSGHERVIGRKRNEDISRITGFGKKQQIERNNNKHRTVSSMLNDIKNLTPEERSRAGGMLDVLEKEHNRGHNRGRGR